MIEAPDVAWLTPSEAATYLRMKESRLRELAQRGLIAKHKDGRLLRFTRDDLDDYVQSCAEPRRNPYQTTRPGRR